MYLIIFIIIGFLVYFYQNSTKVIKKRARKSWDYAINKYGYENLSQMCIYSFSVSMDVGTFKKTMQEFFLEDNILYDAFHSNLVYYLDQKGNHTASASGYQRRGSQPTAPLWALAAYPDVFKYCNSSSNAYEKGKLSQHIAKDYKKTFEKYEELETIMTENYLKYLRDSINFYLRNTKNKLECRAGWLYWR